jgi:hypothetical protein
MHGSMDSLTQVAYRYFVCNVATERWIGLPDPEVTERTYYLRAFRLGSGDLLVGNQSVVIQAEQVG